MLFATQQLLDHVPGPGLLFGLMLLAAITGGYAARWLHIPRVVGFLVGGVALRQILIVLLTPADGGDTQLQAMQQADAPLQAVKDLYRPPQRETME